MSTLAYSRMPGRYETPTGLSGPSPSFTSWDGPSYREGRDPPCPHCEATGIIEDGERIDVDDYRDCVCGECDGTGIGESRHAGDRDTGPNLPPDPLLVLARMRRRYLSDRSPNTSFDYGYHRQIAISPLDHPLPGAYRRASA